jgi:hypothetical protein
MNKKVINLLFRKLKDKKLTSWTPIPLFEIDFNYKIQ